MGEGDTDFDATDMPAFGEREPGIAYPARPGSYAVIDDGDGWIAVEKTPVGFYLPGGGLDPGETFEAALHREVREECGRHLEDVRRIGAAIEYVHTEGREGGIAKHCVFFTGRFAEGPAVGGEPDHELIWLPAAEAARSLRHGSQRQAVELALRTMPGGTAKG